VTHWLHIPQVVHETAHSILETRSEALRVDGHETLTQVGGSVRFFHPAPNVGSESRSCNSQLFVYATVLAALATIKVALRGKHVKIFSSPLI
jgi:hypothetical protein